MEAQKELDPGERAKIIMTSAVSDKKYVMAAVQANCDGFLVKPIIKDRLFDELRKHGFDIPE